MATISELTPIIRQAVRGATREEVSDRLDKFEHKVSELTTMKSTLRDHGNQIKDLEKSLEFSSQEIKDLNEKLIPALDKKFSDLSTKICMNLLNIDVHRRKWSLIINGLKSKQGETEPETHAIVRRFASEKLKMKGVDSHLFSACHRLAQKPDAGIIIRFVDLADRNNWLANAKNLKNTDSGVSLSPDLPPSLCPLKTAILKRRTELPPDQKKVAQVRYIPSWPYVCLRIQGHATLNPRITKETIVTEYLGN